MNRSHAVAVVSCGTIRTLRSGRVCRRKSTCAGGGRSELVRSSGARLMKFSLSFGVGLSLLESSENGAGYLSAGGLGSGSSSRLKRSTIEAVDLGAFR